MSDNENNIKFIENVSKEETYMSDHENKNSSFVNIFEENQENVNLLGNKHKISISDDILVTKDTKTQNIKFKTLKNSKEEYEKINKKLTNIAGIIETKFDKNRKIKEEKNKNSCLECKMESFKFYENFITPNFIQSLNTNEILLKNFHKKNFNDYLNFDDNRNIKNQQHREYLIDIDDILEMDNPDYNKQNSKIEKEMNMTKLNAFDENPFKYNIFKKILTSKKKVESENYLISTLLSTSNLLFNEEVKKFSLKNNKNLDIK